MFAQCQPQCPGFLHLPPVTHWTSSKVGPGRVPLSQIREAIYTSGLLIWLIRANWVHCSAAGWSLRPEQYCFVFKIHHEGISNKYYGFNRDIVTVESIHVWVDSWLQESGLVRSHLASIILTSTSIGGAAADPIIAVFRALQNLSLWQGDAFFNSFPNLSKKHSWHLFQTVTLKTAVSPAALFAPLRRIFSPLIFIYSLIRDLTSKQSM